MNVCVCYQGAAWILSASPQGYQTEDISLVGYVFRLLPLLLVAPLSSYVFFFLFMFSLVALLASLGVLSDSSLDYQTE